MRTTKKLFLFAMTITSSIGSFLTLQGLWLDIFTVGSTNSQVYGAGLFGGIMLCFSWGITLHTWFEKEVKV